MELLAYWAEEPPAHVTLALRYLGPRKRGKVIDEDQARQELAQIGQIVGKQARTLPAHLREMVRGAELLKRQRKGWN